jgi:hypothetical protein
VGSRDVAMSTISLGGGSGTAGGSTFPVSHSRPHQSRVYPRPRRPLRTTTPEPQRSTSEVEPVDIGVASHEADSLVQTVGRLS